MSSIGEFDFLQMIGPQIPLLSAAIEQIDRPGTDGTAFRDDAFKTADIVVQTVEGVSELATANLAADDYAALKGTMVTVVDDLARQVEDVIILDVRVTKVQAIATPSSGAMGNYLVFASWQLKPTL